MLPRFVVVTKVVVAIVVFETEARGLSPRCEQLPTFSLLLRGSTGTSNHSAHGQLDMRAMRFCGSLDLERNVNPACALLHMSCGREPSC